MEYHDGKLIDVQWKTQHPLAVPGYGVPRLRGHVVAEDMQYTMEHPQVREYKGSVYVAEPNLGLLLRLQVRGRIEQHEDHQFVTGVSIVPTKGTWRETPEATTETCRTCGKPLTTVNVHYRDSAWDPHCPQCGVMAALQA